MKQAFLVMCHGNFDILMITMKILDNWHNDFFIHIDKKTPNISIIQEQLQKCVKKSNVYFVKNLSIYWGGYSQIEGELILIKAALENKTEYGYLHLLSGSCLPIKAENEIYDFFNNSHKIEYVQCEDLQQKFFDRIKYYRFFQNYNNKMIRIINRLLIKVQKIFHINRINKSKKYSYGSNWFSITSDFADYVLQHISEIQRTFKYCKNADELFLQTILINSPFISKLYHDSDSNHQNLRFIKWPEIGDASHPITLTSNDLNELLSSKCLFARKFDLNTDRNIVLQLKNKLIS